MSSIELPTIEPKPQPALPSSLVVRYGYLKYLGEFSYSGDARPICGQRVVIRTRRGTELADFVTTTCSNTGCATAISREKVREYIDRSGGNDFPFFTDGRVLRIATPEDLAQQRHLEREKLQYIQAAKQLITEMNLPMRLAEVEIILGGEVLTFYFTSEHRVDFRAMVKALATQFHTRIQMHQVGSRDEARVAADYETCGQHCCCRQFLKVLRPVSMGSAKMQKATLDPQKISGRCGRLKCCLRYEDALYDELRRKLPRVNSRVRIEDGVGTVIETMILTQLVKVRLDESDRFVAVANEEILERDLRDRPNDRAGGDAPGRPPRKPERREREAAPVEAEPAAVTPEAQDATSPIVAEPDPTTQPQQTMGQAVNTATPQAAEDQGADDDGPEEGAPQAGSNPPQAGSPEGGSQGRGVGSLGRRRRRRRRGGGGPRPAGGPA